MAISATGVFNQDRIHGPDPFKDTRIGGRDADSFTPEDLASFERIKTVNTILVEDAGGRYGHSYFRDNPAVLSDIVLALRSRSLPG
ncbi:MAG: hypothetical protein AAFN44_14515, partial [Pseudomonadota bacterium]